MLFIIKMSNYNIISRQNYGLVKGAQIMPRKGENIYKRKDGRWEGRFRKYRDANGKIKYGYVYARSYTEVKIKLNKIKQEITIPAESGTADIIVRTFSEVVKEWITYKTPLLKESSVAKYTNIINLHLLPFFHEQTMQSISVQRLEEFYKKLLLKVTPKGTLLAPKTTLDILSVMKSILVYANTKKYLQYLPPLRFECRPLVKKLVILSERNQKILSSYLCLHLTYRNLGILICMYTGIRLGEICALTWEDISLTEGSIYCNYARVKSYIGYKAVLMTVKPYKENNDYYMVNFRDGKKRLRRRIHRIVAYHFLLPLMPKGIDFTKCEVHHWRGKENNEARYLSICIFKEQHERYDRIRRGIIKYCAKHPVRWLFTDLAA